MTRTSEALEGVFLALGDRTRLRLLNLMKDGEVCVCFFVEVLGEPQPKISRHLAVLRRAGMVTTRRDVKWMHYSIAELGHSTAQRVFAQALEIMADDAEMKRDRAALAKACCSMRGPDLLKRAPRPGFVSVRG